MKRYKFTNEKIFQASVQCLTFLQNEEVSILVKYKLNQIYLSLNKVIEPYIKLRDELVKQYMDANNILSPTLEDGSINPKYTEFSKKIEPINKELNEFECYSFPISIIADVKSSRYYPDLFEFFTLD